MANKNENAEKTYIETEVFDYDFNDLVIDIDFNIPFEFPEVKFDFSDMNLVNRCRRRRVQFPPSGKKIR